MTLDILYGLIYVITALMCAWSLPMLRRFLADTPTIADEGSLEKFKTLARAEMYATIVLFLIVVPAMGLVMVLSVHRGLPALPVVIITNAGLLILGRQRGRMEVQTRTLEVADALAPEYRRVSESWVKKVLPDF